MNRSVLVGILTILIVLLGGGLWAATASAHLPDDRAQAGRAAVSPQSTPTAGTGVSSAAYQAGTPAAGVPGADALPENALTAEARRAGGQPPPENNLTPAVLRGQPQNTVTAVAGGASSSRPAGAVTATPTATATCGAPRWQLVASPSIGNNENQLWDIGGLAPDDAWAVGHYVGAGAVRHTLTEHWDGATWSIIPSADMAGYGNRLLGLAVVGPGDMWAVGTHDSATNAPLLIEHWDGAAWTLVPGPNLGSTRDTYLETASALASNDVWAAGHYQDGSGILHALVLHWDGIVWSVVTLPTLPGTNAMLHGLAVRAANDIWAVGYTASGGSASPLTLHWDGTTWTVVPNPSPVGSILWRVGAAAANDVWATGEGSVGGTVLIEHWDGAAWTVVPNAQNGGLWGLTVRAANDIWAVGGTSNFRLNIDLHWDGSTWQPAPVDNPGDIDNNFRSATTLPGGDIWAVGNYTLNGWNRTMIERLDPGCPSPTVTGTPPTATITRTPTQTRTATPTATPTATATATRTPTPTVTGTPPTATLTATPTLTPNCPRVWQVVPAPNTGTLWGIGGVAANDLWAVGGNQATHTQHWDGAAWTIIPSPNLGTAYNRLYAVGGVASNDIWAVGISGGPVDKSLTMHWDGTAWTIIPSPNIGTGFNTLYTVSAIATDDVWATGVLSLGNATAQTLTIHWDGTTWSDIPSPNPPGGYSEFYGVKALTANDVWAVGYYNQNSGKFTLTAHWDGNVWTVVPSPSSGNASSLWSVAPVSPTDVWAVGEIQYGQAPLIEHWDGSTWTIVPPNSASGGLYGVTMLSANDGWAVGGAGNLLHWNGTTWRQAANPHPGSNMKGVVAVPGGDVWTAGDGSVIMRYTLLCPSPTPTATITPSPTVTDTPTASDTPTPTATVTETQTPGASPSATTTALLTPTTTGTALPTVPPAATSTATPTDCPIQFSDVAPGDPFYLYIRCLACRGVLNGYSASPPCVPGAAPCFLPVANVTRGQLAKILANAAGFLDAIPSTRQTFSDVPSSQPFWVYIERLSAHGAINGYTCGGVGEPCDPQHRPYYRPGVSATRGQIAKIDALAAAIPDPIPSTQQTFADVPPTEPFWLWIEQLAGRGIVSGYTCGAPGEPCPGLYYRPGAATTRGQLAKIAANTFYPNCQTPARR